MNNKALLLLTAVLVLMVTACLNPVDTTKEYTVTPTTVYEGDDRYAILQGADYWEGYNAEWDDSAAVAFYGDEDSDGFNECEFVFNPDDYSWVGWPQSVGTLSGSEYDYGGRYRYDDDSANGGHEDGYIFTLDKVTDDYIEITFVDTGAELIMYPESL